MFFLVLLGMVVFLIKKISVKSLVTRELERLERLEELEKYPDIKAGDLPYRSVVLKKLVKKKPWFKIWEV